MTLQTILYFSSILLTCLLTGFLAWYAWKHGQVPASRAYMRLTLSECFFALTEIFSVLSPSSTMALFWFQVRYLAGAFMGVFWFVFALEYSGRKEWLSKRLMAGLFIIPFVTQVLLWSNSLHGLWIKQEAGFTQSGPFWIVDITSRVPGLGYLTHSFYSLLLTLAGIALMFLTAWRMRRELRGQAVMLTGAGLTAFLFTMNSLFNFLPKTGFNLFTPGIGLSVLLIALSVYRFEFLKRVPVDESASLTRLNAQEKYSAAVLLLTFLLFTSGLAAVGYLTYQNYEKQYRVQIEAQLSAIAKLKMSEIVNWRAARMGDAESFYSNPAFAELVQKSLENPGDTKAQTQLQSWLDTVRNGYHYDRVFLLDTRGVERVSSPAAPEPVAKHLTQELAAIIKTGQVKFLDFHRDLPNDTIHLALLVPIYAEQDRNRPLGLLVLRIDPEIYLYPFLQEWPVPSQSAETLLIRRDGEDALFLNPLRFQPDAALNLRIPLKQTEILAVKAVLGLEGVTQGLDYRGNEVIGDLRAVPDSPWLLVARMDTAEVYAPLRERLWQINLLFGALILAAGAGLIMIWRQQQIRSYRGQIEAAGALRASEEKFRLAFDTSPDSVAITRLSDGMFVSVNKGFEQISGYTREQAIGKTSAEINIWKNPEDRGKVVEGLRAKGEVRNYEAPFLTRNGEIFGLMSAVIMELNGEPHILNITRDITERRQAEEALREVGRVKLTLLEKLNEAQQFAMFGNWEWDLSTDHVWWSDETYRIFGVTPQDFTPSFEANGRFVHPDDLENYSKSFEHSLQTGEPLDLDIRLITNAGVLKHCQARGKVNYDDSGKPIRFIGTIMDITERKQAEEELRESEERFRRAVFGAPFPIMIHAEDGEVVTINTPWTELTGYEHSDIPTIANWTQKAYGARMELVRADIDILYAMDGPKAEGEYTIMTRSGQTRIWDFSSAPIGQLPDGRRLVISMATDITERKRTEEALGESEARLRTILDATPFPIALVDVQDNNIEFWSRSALTLFGHTAPTTTEWYQMAYPDPDYRREVVERWKPALEKAQQTAQAVNAGEYRVTCRDGSERVCELHAAFLAGKLVVTFNDITERKQVEEALRESEDKFKYVFDNSVIGKSITLPSGEINVNKSFCDMLGYSQEELKGGKWQEISHPDDIELTQEIISSLLSGEKKSARFTKRYLHKNGAVVWTDVSTALRRDKDGQPFYFMTAVLDITERKQAEDALRESEERLNLAQQSSNTGWWDWDMVTSQLKWSRELFGLFGLDPETGRATFEAWDQVMHPDDKTSAYERLDIAVKNGTFLDSEYRIIQPDGQIKWIRAMGRANYNTEHKPVRMSGICIDITERKQAEEALQEYNIRLETEVENRTRELRETQEQLVRQERLAALGQLAGSIGHELRNPLGVISNAVYFLKLSQPNASEKVKEYLEIIEKETRTSDKIITDLLDFTRIKSLDSQPVSVSELIDQTLKRYPVPESVETTLEIPADLPQIFADPQHVVQILGNLIINACQALPATGGRMYISTALHDNLISINVRDTGMGIAPENMKKLFEPLYTTKTKGIGLGLAISRKLAEANGGRIEVESEAGKGSTFTVYLPVYEER